MTTPRPFLTGLAAATALWPSFSFSVDAHAAAADGGPPAPPGSALTANDPPQPSWSSDEQHGFAFLTELFGAAAAAKNATSSAGAAGPTQKASYQVGEAVWYFHREYRDKNEQNARIAVVDRAHGIYRPRIGLTEGWLPGEVVEIVVRPAGEDSTTSKKSPRRTKKRQDHLQEASPPSSTTSPPQHFYRIRTAHPDWVDPKGIFCCSDEAGIDAHLHRTVSVEDLRAYEPKAAGEMKSENLMPPAAWTNKEQQPPPPKTALTVFAFRWGGRYVPATKDSEFLATSPNFLYQITDLGLQKVLGRNNYQVWSVFLATPEDCASLAKTFALLFPKGAHPGRVNSEKSVSFWMTHPSSFDYLSEPMYQTGSAYGAGYVEQGPFFDLMRASERAGIYTAFPHNALLYQQLASKSWTSQLALDPQFMIPATVSFPRQQAVQNPAKAAAQAIETLENIKLRQLRSRDWYQERMYANLETAASSCTEPGTSAADDRSDKKCAAGAVVGAAMKNDHSHREVDPAPARGDYLLPHERITRGVAKLGYSWEALDVKLWKNDVGNYSLADALEDMSDSVSINGERVGQAHLLDWVLIQEFVPHAVEMRLYYVKNRLAQVWYTRFDKVKQNHEFGDFYYMNEQVALSYLRGDIRALREATKKGERIAENLLAWLSTQSGQREIPAVRFDFFVQYFPEEDSGESGSGDSGSGGGARKNKKSWVTYEEEHDFSVTNRTVDPTEAKQRGTTEVMTLEICEAGFSIFGSEELKKEKVAALIENAIKYGGS
mmetsp:Transcript_22936/g.57981  ORF Transcript_22936/g.57981 Transcript_22936/m.57981 type:complete len:773 (+) Transcript_22936:332-2650(+)|eukprot:CAMPEP_0178988808 /NCGR_PEP_ID=MMETSP0795-20121207/4008_1 /TAXON_ID=88552 /ORGANISM="Amoebophrya sp., Strain Ameob2" /LENGTH=772 /DNA_ID=CAMNT_0020680107 /DNA_START=445 /DNA_END=2763 /DNA_ORIENTATION=+